MVLDMFRNAGSNNEAAAWISCAYCEYQLNKTSQWIYLELTKVSY
jgi:hypothetical protein